MAAPLLPYGACLLHSSTQNTKHVALYAGIENGRHCYTQYHQTVGQVTLSPVQQTESRNHLQKKLGTAVMLLCS